MTSTDSNIKIRSPFLEGIAKCFDFVGFFADISFPALWNSNPLNNDWQAVCSDYNNSIASPLKKNFLILISANLSWVLFSVSLSAPSVSVVGFILLSLALMLSVSFSLPLLSFPLLCLLFMGASIGRIFQMVHHEIPENFWYPKKGTNRITGNL